MNRNISDRLFQLIEIIDLGKWIRLYLFFRITLGNAVIGLC